MSVWNLKNTGFFVRGLPIQIAVNGEPETREKNTRCQVLLRARQAPQNPRSISSAEIRFGEFP